MGLSQLIKDGDWVSVRQAIAKLSVSLGFNSSPTFAGLTLTGLTANSLIYTPATKVLTSLGAATNGQIPIGSTGAIPVLATITGTANQVVSTPGAGSITLSLPQNIHTAATPTFADLTLSTPVNIYALNHDSFAGFVADEHVAHTGVSILAGTGMSGGGDISASRTLNCSITQYTDELAQDAVGGMVADTNTIDLTYTDLTPALSADLRYQDTTSVDLAVDANGLKATVLPAGVDHDALLNFAADEHFTQVNITNVSSALSTGLLKVTTGTGALSVVTDASANWNTAYGWGNHASAGYLTSPVAIANGGTGQTTAQAAIDALTAAAGATNEHVLTKDTVTGNAIFKAAAGGSDVKVAVDAAATAGYLGAANADVLRTSTGITKTDGGDFITLTTNDSQIDHDALSNFLAEEHQSHKNICRIHLSADQTSVASGSWVKVLLDTDSLDPDNVSDLANNRITPNKAGYYSVVGLITWVGAYVVAANVYTVGLFKNGAPGVGETLFTNQVHSGITGSGLSSITPPIPVYFNGTTDYVQLYAIHYSGSRTDIDGSSEPITSLWVIREG